MYCTQYPESRPHFFTFSCGVILLDAAKFDRAPQQSPQLATRSAAMRDASASADRLISTTIYVGNLPFAVSEAELRGLVLTRMPAEALGSVSVVRNPLGRSKGFGFVGFQTEQQAQQAIASLSSVILQGRTLVVEKAAGGGAAQFSDATTRARPAVVLDLMRTHGRRRASQR